MREKTVPSMQITSQIRISKVTSCILQYLRKHIGLGNDGSAIKSLKVESNLQLTVG